MILVMAEFENLNIHICLNKIDLESEENSKLTIYILVLDTILLILALQKNIGIELREQLRNNITVFAGPSGVGKSSLLNKIHPGLDLKLES